uniref:Uncharacterized protein n=1 Tax=Ciona savignyi TaxID=51511 RepID=H2Y941_CIOSA
MGKTSNLYWEVAIRMMNTSTPSTKSLTGIWEKDDRVDRCTKLFPTQVTTNQKEPFGGSKDIVTADLDALPVMLLKCVLHPISVHSDLVNRCVVQHFMKDLGMMKHFEMLRHFLLL